jgi:PAS domain S-box-containing protein
MRFTSAIGMILFAYVVVTAPAAFRRPAIYIDLGLILAVGLGSVVPVSTLVRFLILESVFFGSAAGSMLYLGMSPGLPVLLSLMVIVATIYRGVPGGVIASVAALVLIGLGGLGWTSGFLPVQPDLQHLSPVSYHYWVRVLLAEALGVFSTVGIVNYISGAHRSAMGRMRVAEEKFSTAFRICPDAMAIVELETGRFIDVNESHERMTGYRREEALGHTFGELGSFLGEQDFRKLVGELKARGTVRNIDARIRNRAGRTVEVSYGAERYVLDGRACAVLVIKDVTEQRRVQAALIESEARVRSFVENATVGIYRSTPDGKIVMANRALIRIMGYSSLEELASRNLETEGYEPSYPREQFKARIEEAGFVSGWETAWKRRDGSTIYVRESASVIRSEDGRILFYDGIIEDISERKDAEQALRDSEERYRNLTSAAFEGVFITDEGRVIDVNDQGLRLLGCERHELIGRSVVDFIGEESRAVVAENIRLRREVAYVHTMIRKDGSIFHAEAQAKMMTIGGRTLRMTALRDVSDRIQNEQRRRALEEQTRQTQKMEALGTLAGGIAHDFNNILTGILGNLQLTELELSEGHPATEAVASSVQACRRARELVARILSFSRMEQDDREPAPMGPTVLEAIELLKVGLPANVDVRTEMDPGCARVLHDPSQIHQVVMNLGTNSAHAMRERGGSLTLSLRQVTPSAGFRERHPQVAANHTVCFSMADTGCGMDAGVLKHLFEPFYTTKRGHGTGLGLAMVHAIVKGHGGSIVVDSTPGAGTSFHLFFPAAADTQAPPAAAEPARRPGAFAPFGNGRRIMLVDDQEVVRSIGGVFLRRLGFEAMVFERPEDAINAFLLAPDEVALVISDLSMPEMTGLEMAERLMAIRPGLPVLIASGHLPSETQQRADAVGIRGVISKPFELQDMIGHIRSIVDGEAPDARAARPSASRQGTA